jgi:hypothetical protein
MDAGEFEGAGVMSDSSDAMAYFVRAYATWRMDMWLEGYGSYEDIEWAVRWRILRPFSRPKRTKAIRKWIIRKLRRQNDE